MAWVTERVAERRTGLSDAGTSAAEGPAGSRVLGALIVGQLGLHSAMAGLRMATLSAATPAATRSKPQTPT